MITDSGVINIVQVKNESTTKIKIIESAKNLFSHENYRSVSVAMITNHAGVNSSLFYRYFPNKSALLTELITEAVKNLKTQCESLTFPEELPKALKVLVKWMANFDYENLEDMRILHEVEFTSVNTDKQIQAIFDSSIQRILPDQVKEFGLDVVRWFVLGSMRFLVTYYTIWNGEKVPEKCFDQLVKFVLNGLDPNRHIMDHRVFDAEVKQLEMKENTTRSKILQAAEKLFGTNGFKETKISNISNEANVASGTFYLYFKSKHTILEELVLRTNMNLRRILKSVINEFQDRRDAEIAGFFVFLQFFKIHPNMYAVVREAEFFTHGVAMEYYDKIKRSYLRPINRAVEKGQFRKYDPEVLALSLMGVGHYMGMDMLFLSSASDIDFIRKLIKLSRLLYKGVRV